MRETTETLAAQERHATNLARALEKKSDEAEQLEGQLAQARAELAAVAADAAEGHAAQESLRETRTTVDRLEREVADARAALAAADSRAKSFQTSLEAAERASDAAAARLVEVEQEAENNASYAKQLSGDLDALTLTTDGQAAKGASLCGPRPLCDSNCVLK